MQPKPDAKSLRIPQSLDAQAELDKLADEFEAEGDWHSAGLCLTLISQSAKHIGCHTGVNGWQATVDYGDRAAECLRKTNDRAALAAALRSSATPMANPNYRDVLLEALEISRQAGDLEGEAWAQYHLSGPAFDPTPLVEAERIFRSIGDKGGLAACLVRQGVRFPKSRERAEGIWEGARLYAEIGNPKEAGRSGMIADTFGRDFFSIEERRNILEWSAERSLEASEHGTAAALYKSICQLFEDEGNHVEADVYRAKADSFDAQIYGSRKNRLLADKEHIEEALLQRFQPGEGYLRPRFKKKLRAIEAELKQIAAEENSRS